MIFKGKIIQSNSNHVVKATGQEIGNDDNDFMIVTKSDVQYQVDDIVDITLSNNDEKELNNEITACKYFQGKYHYRMINRTTDIITTIVVKNKLTYNVNSFINLDINRSKEQSIAQPVDF